MLDLQFGLDNDASPYKLIALGNILEDVYRAKLAWQFPDRPCEVEFYLPKDREDLLEYQISFWQTSEEAGIEASQVSNCDGTRVRFSATSDSPTVSKSALLPGHAP